MIESILGFFANNKEIVAATATITEVLVIIINFWRKAKAEKAVVKTLVAFEVGSFKPTTTGKKFLWSINPINLFRKA